MRRLVLVLAFAVLMLSSACLAEEPVSAPGWAAVRHERAGWTLRVVNVERVVSINLADVFASPTKGVLGSVTPPAGTEYFVVTVSGEAAKDAAEITLANIAVIDAAGLRHESMLTRFDLNAGRATIRIPTPVPVGAEMHWFDLDGLRWPLLTSPPVSAESK